MELLDSVRFFFCLRVGGVDNYLKNSYRGVPDQLIYIDHQVQSEPGC